MRDDFEVTIGAFTGPLDLLLQLIEKRKLFIGDVSLAAVADEFLTYLEEMDNFPIESVAHFLVIASTLLLIKSRSLLPHLELTEEESEDIEGLQRRLTLYKEIQHLSKYVEERFGTYILFPSQSQIHLEPIFSPHEELTRGALHKAAEKLIDTFPPAEDTRRAIVENVMSLEEMIDSLTDRIKKSATLSFNETAGAHKITNKEEKLTVIISFLALLELVKKGVVAAQQGSMFDDIAIAESSTSHTTHI